MGIQNEEFYDNGFDEDYDPYYDDPQVETMEDRW